MIIRPYIAWMLFGSSYIPLFLMVAVRSLETSLTLSIVLFSLSTLLFLLLIFLFKYALRKMAIHHIEAKRIESKGNIVIGYLVTYIFPILEVDYSDVYYIIGLAIVMFVVGVVYINSNMIYVNPMLSLFGYKIFEVINIQGNVFILITKSRNTMLKRNFTAHFIGEQIYLEVENGS